MKQYIAYYRVSTQRQGRSGLGLEAQQKAVADYARNATILAHYSDIESGKSNTRIELLKAIQHAKNTDATLVIAKLDRLSRNVQFISALMESKVKFVCCDLPDATNLTIHIFAALAQWERERIQERIKEALKAKKNRGDQLGNISNLTQEGRIKGAERRRQIAAENKILTPARAIAQLMREQGSTLLQIADKLNNMKITTAKGHKYRTEQVRRLLA